MLIAFTGKLGSGKDTAGARLAELAAIDAHQLSFAKPLKESAAALLNIDPVMWETWKNDPDIRIVIEDKKNPSQHITDISAREFLQRYGTESHRDIFGQDFWVDQAMVKYYPLNNVYYYYTDCRFPNEALAVKQRGGVIVRILGNNDETGGHVSEAGLADEFIDFSIDNSVRDDEYSSLDGGLTILAQMIGIPLAR